MFSDVCLIKAPKRNLVLERIVFEVCPFLVALLYFAYSCSKPTRCVSMKHFKKGMISSSEIKWNKADPLDLFFDLELTKFFFFYYGFQF